MNPSMTMVPGSQHRPKRFKVRDAHVLAHRR